MFVEATVELEFQSKTVRLQKKASQGRTISIIAASASSTLQSCKNIGARENANGTRERRQTFTFVMAKIWKQLIFMLFFRLHFQGMSDCAEARH